MAKVEKVLVIGAGPAGLATALCLKQRNGISSTIYEIRAEPTTLGGAVAVSCNGTRLLDRLGIHEDLLLQAAPTPKTAAYSSQGYLLGELEIGTWSSEKTGYGQIRVKRTDLQESLLDALRKERIQIYYDKQLVAIEEDGKRVTVTFSDGTTDTGDLLLGCDGIHSSVRKIYVDPQVQPEYSGISSIYSFVPMSELPHPRPPPATMAMTLTRNGVFAVAPCSSSNSTLYWFFSHEVPIPDSGNTRDGWEEHGRKAADGFKPMLLNVLNGVQGDWGILLRDIIQQTEVVKFYPIFRLPLGGKWSKGRCLLLGDAGHAMQPHAGQGVSMALEDAFLLSRLLNSPSTLPEVFEKFDRIRRPRVEKFYKIAMGRGEQRKKTGAWKHWMKETAFWALIWVFRSCGLDRWGFGEGDLVYDIDEEQI